MPAVRTETLPDGLEIAGLQLRRPDGAVLLRDLGLRLRPGQALLIKGPSGCGKTTLLRALAGLWPHAEGSVRRPQGASALFLSQRPYLPLGDLRGALAYPGLAQPEDDARLVEALERVNLGHLAGRLDEVADWARILSIGEQQRLAFARVLFNRPAIVFLDEATSATDEGLEHALYSLLRTEIPSCMLVSVGHRSTLDAFHTHRLELDGAGGWTMDRMERGGAAGLAPRRGLGPVDTKRSLAQAQGACGRGQVPTRKGLVSLRRAATTLCAVMRPVLGLAEGMFWISIEIEAESEATSTRWTLRSSEGSAQISRVVRSGPMPASETLTATFRLAGNPTVASRGEPRNTRRGSGDAGEVDVVFGEIGRAQQAAHRLARDHRDGVDDAFRRGGDGVQAEDGAGRHHDLALVGARELDQVVVAQQRAGAQHHQLLAGAQHRFGDVAEHGGGRAFDDHVAKLVQGVEGGEGGGAVGPGEGRRGLGVAHRDGGQRQAGQPGVQGLRHGLADGAEAGDADAVVVHRDPKA